MGSAGYLHSLCEALRVEALAGLAQSRTGVAPPARSYVSHGEPGHDGCDHLVVWHDAPSFTQQASNGARGKTLSTFTTFWVEVARCLPRGHVTPTVARLAEDAENLNRDLWCLITWLRPRVADVFDTCPQVTWGEAEVLDESGGMAGWRLSFTALLNDPGPA